MSKHVFILGVQKCGTTSLASLLSTHPDIFLPSVKETYFFCDDDKYEKGEKWYHDEFYTQRNEHILLDATPFYLASQKALDRVINFADKDTRYIILLRDPVHRAYSAYWHQVRLGNEELSFEEALAAEGKRIDEAHARKTRWWRHAYTKVGMYAEQLSYLYDRVDASCVLVLEQNQLNDSDYLANTLPSFLGVENQYDFTERERNVSSMPRFRTIQKMVKGKSPLKSLVQKLVPREFRSAVGRKILEGTSKEFKYPVMKEETNYELRERFEESNRQLMDMGFTFAEKWTR
ncbi:MAG: sulfotransferase [Candidatus Thiodiazotropha sp.]